jgi:hypothetical protein
MTRQEFIQIAKARGIDKETAFKKYQELDSLGKFSDSEPVVSQEPAPQPQPAQEQQASSNPFEKPLEGARERTIQRFQTIDKPTTLGSMMNLQRGSIPEAIVGTPERMARTGLGAFGSVADFLIAAPVEAGMNLANMATGGRAGQLAQGAIEATGIAKPLSKLAQKYQEYRAALPESEQANLDAAVSGASGLGQMAGVKTAPKLGGKILPATEKGVVKEAKTLGEIGKGKDKVYTQMTGEKIDVSKVKQPGFPFLKELNQADARELTRPRAPETIPLRKYAEQQAVADINAGEGVMDASQLAATNATRAFKEIDEARNSVGETIQKIVENHPGAKVDISDIKQAYNEMAAKTLNIKPETPKLYDAKGNIIKPSSPSITSSEQGLKIHNEISGILNDLPDELNAADALALKRRLREKIKYDAQGQYRTQSTPMEGVEKKVAQLIDTKLDNVLPGFKDANKAYSEYVGLEDAFGKALGKELVANSGVTKHGASIMKRAVKSLADSDVRGIFKEVKRLTNGRFDLLQDAHSANIIMMGSPNERMVQKASSMGELIKAGNKGNLTERALSQAEKIAAHNRNKRIVDWHEKQLSNAEKQKIKDSQKGSSMLGNNRGSIGANPQVHTDNFKQWFGDWDKAPEKASKVVDESGKPLAVFHGSSADFTKFEGGENIGKISGDTYGDDVFSFSDSPRVANEYANAEYSGSKRVFGKDYNIGTEGANIKKVYLDIKNPYVIDAKDNSFDYSKFFGKKGISDLKKEGYDGVIIKNVHDNLGYQGLSGGGDTYMVFNPNQIKSATGNSGAFSKAINDIRGNTGLKMLAGTTAAGVGGATLAGMVQNRKKGK